MMYLVVAVAVASGILLSFILFHSYFTSVYVGHGHAHVHNRKKLPRQLILPSCGEGKGRGTGATNVEMWGSRAGKGQGNGSIYPRPG